MAGENLTPAHRELIKLLAGIAVERYLAESEMMDQAMKTIDEDQE